MASLPRCSKTGKVIHQSEKSARAALAILLSKDGQLRIEDLDIFRCQHCGGGYHLGTRRKFVGEVYLSKSDRRRRRDSGAIPKALDTATAVLWRDQRNRPLADRLRQAAAYYRRKTGQHPELFFCSPSDLTDNSVVLGLRGSVCKNIQTGEFWLGVGCQDVLEQALERMVREIERCTVSPLEMVVEK